MNVKKAIAAQEALIPESGYNLVGIDTYGSPDEQGPYLAGHYKDEAKAIAEKAAREAENPHVTYHIYGPASE